MVKQQVRGGFNSSLIKPVLRSAELLPAGKHNIKIVGVEMVSPKPTESFEQTRDDQQLRLLCKNSSGIISAYLTGAGYVKSDELATMSESELPADINFKALGTTKKDFEALPMSKKVTVLCTTSDEGYAVRKDNRQRILSAKHTQEAQEITGGALAAAGIPEDAEFEENDLPGMLLGKCMRIRVSERDWQGTTQNKVSAFYPVSEDVEEELADIS